MIKNVFKNMLLEADGKGGGNIPNDVNKENMNADVDKSLEKNEQEAEKSNNDMDRLLQARLDKAMAEERKKTSLLQKELDKIKQEKMTAEELKKYDDEKKDKELAERERTILEKENRYYAIMALKKSGLDDGSEIALDLANIVMGSNNEETDSKIKTLSEVINKMVDNKVNERFKSFGRVPNNSNVSIEDTNNTLAESLGKTKAEQNKRSNDILKYYIK